MKNAESGAKQRSEPSYPYYDLDASIQFSAIVKKIGGSKGTVKKSLLAKEIGLAESTPSFFQRLSATKTFKLIDGWGSYSLTDLGRGFFYPQSENESKAAILKAFSAPKAFEVLLTRFDGDKLPSTEILGNIVHQECEVPPSWKDRVAQMFVRSASYAGIIDSNGFLRYDAAMPTKDQLEWDRAQAKGPESETAAERAAKVVGQQTGLRFPIQYPATFNPSELSLPLESGKVISIPQMSEGDFDLMLETLKLWKRRIVKQSEPPAPQSE